MANTPRLPRWPGTPDPTRICAACKHYRRPSFFASRLAGAQPMCMALPVRGVTIDLVSGHSTLHPPRSCDMERNGVTGECGPEGRYFEARNG